MKTIYKGLAVAGIGALLAAGCATTSFERTWSAPEAPQHDFEGKRVIALVAVDEPIVRRTAEEELVEQLRRAGADPVAAHNVLPGQDFRNLDKAHEAFGDTKAEGVVVMRVVGVDEEYTYAPGRVYTPGYWGHPFYADFWGFYDYGVTVVPPRITENTVVSIETTVYDTGDEGRLLWGGLSETTNPGRVERLFDSAASETVEALKQAGILT